MTVKFISPHGTKTNILIGLINDKPYFVYRSGKNKAIEKYPDTTELDQYKDYEDIYLRSPFQTCFKFKKDWAPQSPIKWLKVTEYCWEDTLTYDYMFWYYRTVMWKSQKFGVSLSMSFLNLESVIKEGIQPGGIYKGVFCFSIQGALVNCFATRIIDAV